MSHPVFRDDGGDLTGQVLHVHWQNIVLQPSRNHAQASSRLREFRSTLPDLIERGLKLVWTVHNRIPHDVDYYFHEIEVCRLLARYAHVIHVLSKETVDEVADLFELDPAKVVLVEHGSYAGVYPELLDRAAARERLGLSPDQRVVLFFGGVRRYKGLGTLIEAMERIYEFDRDVQLVIAGNPGHSIDDGFVERLEHLPFVTLDLRFIPESDVHVYFRAADLQVAPYSAVLNSGSVLLGLAFGVAVVAPRLGALRSLADEPFMFTYAPPAVAERERALRVALDHCADPIVSQRAVEFANRYTGEDMSEEFVSKVLERIFEPLPQKVLPGPIDERG